MPFYEYECESCGFADTLLEKIDAPSLRRCPRCRKRAWRRLISPAAFHLKGGGWYVTDFRNPPKKDKGESGGGKTTTDESGGGKTPADKSGDGKTTADKSAKPESKSKTAAPKSS